MSAGAISGTIAHTGASIVNYNYVYMYGADSNTNGVFNYQFVTGNGSYSFSPLVPGTYGTYAYTYFNAPYGYVQAPFQYVNVTGGTTTTRNFGGPLAFMRGGVVLDGFFTTANITDGYGRATDSTGTAFAEDQMTLPAATFDL